MMADKQTEKAVAIRFRDFGFSYPDGRPVLKAINLDIADGAFLLLVGKTGSGKTTLLRCCKPEIAPVGERRGQLELPGEEQGSAVIGFVFQDPENQIVCDTVWHELAFGLENLAVPETAMRRRVAECAHFFGLEPLLHLETASLSGGQKQLVNLAAVLALQPRVLLLDEPTAALDPVAEKSFLHALFRVNRELGITVVVATHAPETMIDYATEAILLEGGQVRPLPLDELRPQVSDVRGAQQLNERELRAQISCSQVSAAPERGPRVSTRHAPRNNELCVKHNNDPCVKLSDVFFRYGRDRAWVFRGLDVQVARGSVHAFVGGNGSGKTTLLRLMARVLKPERGRVNNKHTHEQVLLPQDPKALFVCDTVREELAEWQDRCGFSDEEIEEVAERFELSSLLSQHPFDLSGGQQQLLAFAKLMLARPMLLFLDEPSKGLDAEAKCLLAQAICDCIDAGASCVIATHDLSFLAAVADMVSMVFDGMLASTETPEAFFSSNLFYRYRTDAFALRWAAMQDGA